MPVYEFMCSNEHIKESFCHKVEDRDALTIRCDECNLPMKRIISRINPLLYFETDNNSYSYLYYCLFIMNCQLKTGGV